MACCRQTADECRDFCGAAAQQRQGDDTMTESRHRHVVTQPLCDIRKSCLFFR
jgi:hypothetical protein